MGKKSKKSEIERERDPSLVKKDSRRPVDQGLKNQKVAEPEALKAPGNVGSFWGLI